MTLDQQQLRNSDMMAHLLDALENKQDIGHYGRLVFAMVARHFGDDEDLIDLLSQDPGCSEEEARSLVAQVQSRDYNPPKRERILEWQAQQEFPICPNADDPGSCNVYRDLTFPDHVYEEIQEFYEQVGEAHQTAGKSR
jgi:hypothetical protein